MQSFTELLLQTGYHSPRRPNSFCAATFSILYAHARMWHAIVTMEMQSPVRLGAGKVTRGKIRDYSDHRETFPPV